MSKIKIPKRPKTIAERLTTLALRRLALEDQVKAIRSEEHLLATGGLEVFQNTSTPQIKIEGVGTVTVKKVPIATVKDWAKLYAFAAASPESGVVHKRSSPTAIEGLLLAGTDVPGVVIDHKYQLDVNVRAGRKGR